MKRHFLKNTQIIGGNISRCSYICKFVNSKYITKCNKILYEYLLQHGKSQQDLCML